VNTSGTALDHVVYDSYGTIVTETNASNGDRFKYAGMEYDSVTGQYYDRARYYNAATARFMSQDPLGFVAGDADLYRYVRNAATDSVDGSGLLETPPDRGPVEGGGTLLEIITRFQQQNAAREEYALMVKYLKKLLDLQNLRWTQINQQYLSLLSDQNVIFLNRNYMRKRYNDAESQTAWAALRTVHEVTHLMDYWQHGKGNSIDEELRALQNELAFYRWLTTQAEFQNFHDADMDKAIERMGAGESLRQIVQSKYKYQEHRDNYSPSTREVQ